MPHFEAELRKLNQDGRYRSLARVSGVDFTSNDYLGLSVDREIQSALVDFLKTAPRLGSTGSRLLSGESAHLSQTEAELAATFLSETSLIYGSGYLASLGVCSALDTGETEFFSDEKIHASWIDGLRLAKGRKTIHPHLDLKTLEQALIDSNAKRKVILTESVFSMDGDRAPLADLSKMASRFHPILVVDEAHGTGVFGEQGLGETRGLKASHEVIAVHTGGKALGAYGAFVCCSADFKNLMINKSRSQIFSTALPPLAVEHLRLATRRLRTHSNPHARLHENLDYIRSEFLKLNLTPPESQIIPIQIGSNEDALNAAQNFQNRGLGVKAVRYPTVPLGQARLRLSITARHTRADLQHLVSTLRTEKTEKRNFSPANSRQSLNGVHA